MGAKRVVYNASVDPGVNALGWAAWRVDEWGDCAAPAECGVIKVRGLSRPWDQKLNDLMHDYRRLVHMRFYPWITFVEWPEFRSGNAVGNAAAARGDLGHLCFAVGRHAEMVVAGSLLCAFEPVSVSKWKGQLTKKAVMHRIAKKIGTQSQAGKPIASHAWDAVGVGLYAKGCF